jgi:hypothetical protein
MLVRGYVIWGLLVLLGFTIFAASGARIPRGGPVSGSRIGGHGTGFHSTSGWSWGK